VKKDKYEVRLLRLADEDLTEIILYIAQDNLSAAERLLTKIEGSLIRLESHPLLGRVPNDEELMKSGYRFLVIENYLIFYTIEAKLIFINRIVHGARDYLRILH
jgi:toxin ParE1/3/4